MCIQVSGRIRRLGFNCHVKDIFSYKSIKKLSAFLLHNQSLTAIKSEQGSLTGEFDFLPIQQWFVERVENGELAVPGHFNQSILIKVPELDMNRLSLIIHKLVEYHDILRVKYRKDKVWRQIYQPSISGYDVKILDVRMYKLTELQEVLTSWQSGFDLEKGPLFQSGYLYGYKDGTARVYFAFHHMIIDAVSWRILAEDVQALYEGVPLPPKGSSFRQWVSRVRDYAFEHPQEATYWESQLSEIPNHFEASHYPAAASFELSHILTKSLLQEASKAYRTEINEILLTALVYALKDINHSNTQYVTLEGHGREEIDPSIDHSRTIGWFTAMFPVKLELKDTLKASILSVKEHMRNIPNKGIGFGSFLAANRINTSAGLVPVSFNYFGQFGSANENDTWQLVREESGRNIHPDNCDFQVININGMVNNGKLSFEIVSKLGEQTTKQLTDRLQHHLTFIIEHCCHKWRTEGSSISPSDFKGPKLSQSLLDRLQLEINLHEE